MLSEVNEIRQRLAKQTQTTISQDGKNFENFEKTLICITETITQMVLIIDCKRYAHCLQL